MWFCTPGSSFFACTGLKWLCDILLLLQYCFKYVVKKCTVVASSSVVTCHITTFNLAQNRSTQSVGLLNKVGASGDICRPISSIKACSGQAVNVVASRSEDRGSESSYRRSTFSLGSALFATTAFQKIRIVVSLINELKR